MHHFFARNHEITCIPSAETIVEGSPSRYSLAYAYRVLREKSVCEIIRRVELILLFFFFFFYHYVINLRLFV